MYLLASYLVFCYSRTNLLAVKSLFPSESVLHAAVLPQTLIYGQDDFESAIGNGSFRDCEASPNKRCETESLATNFFNSKNKLQCNFQQLLALIFENLKKMATFCKIEKFISICLEFQVLFNICLFQLSLFPKFLLFASTVTNDISRPFFTMPSWTSCPSSNLACDLQQIFFQNFSITFKILVSLSALFELLDVGAKVTSNTLFMQFIYFYPGCKLYFGFFHFLFLKSHIILSFWGCTLQQVRLYVCHKLSFISPSQVIIYLRF